MEILTNTWWYDAVFYHIYPLGFCGASAKNDFAAEPANRLDRVKDHIPHIVQLGCDALYLGPLFESTAHGYDTADYRRVDRRLGTEETLRDLVAACHDAGISVVLDGVFNHVGRDFWAFRHVREAGSASPYASWFKGIDFSQNGPANDGFTYDGWEGDQSLVALDHSNADARAYLLDSARWMIETFGIDGFRLDVAYMIDRTFLADLAGMCRDLRPDFWLMGEMIHGDYREITGPEMLDSATNYECYKGIYSSHNDLNYWEIAWSLNRQFGAEGMYRDLQLYNFVDNHDVTRAASVVKDPRHLPLMYVLLFTMPGTPSVYYGSELGWRAHKDEGDGAIRPTWTAQGEVDLTALVEHLASTRAASNALRRGNYRQLHVSNEQFCFERATGDERVIVALNASDRPADVPADNGGSISLKGCDWEIV